MALHASGSLDFLWNFRVVDQLKTTTPLLLNGIVEDIYADFDFCYYKVTEFINSHQELRELKLRDPTLHKHVLQVLNQEMGDANPNHVNHAREFMKKMTTRQILFRCCNQWK
jgi:hypothetical protein